MISHADCNVLDPNVTIRQQATGLPWLEQRLHLGVDLKFAIPYVELNPETSNQKIIPRGSSQPHYFPDTEAGRHTLYMDRMGIIAGTQGDAIYF